MQPRAYISDQSRAFVPGPNTPSNNHTLNDADIMGWFLSDSARHPGLPAKTIVLATNVIRRTAQAALLNVVGMEWACLSMPCF